MDNFDLKKFLSENKLQTNLQENALQSGGKIGDIARKHYYGDEEAAELDKQYKDMEDNPQAKQAGHTYEQEETVEEGLEAFKKIRTGAHTKQAFELIINKKSGLHASPMRLKDGILVHYKDLEDAQKILTRNMIPYKTSQPTPVKEEEVEEQFGGETTGAAAAGLDVLIDRLKKLASKSGGVAAKAKAALEDLAKGAGYAMRREGIDMADGSFLDTDAEEIDLALNVQGIANLVDYLESKYTAGTDYILHIDRGDETYNAISLINPKLHQDRELMSMIDSINSVSEKTTSREEQLKAEINAMFNEEETLDEGSYFDRYDSAASRKVGHQLRSIVDIFSKSADQERQELEQAIVKAEEETGTEVSRYEKANLEQHMRWIRVHDIQMER